MSASCEILLRVIPGAKKIELSRYSPDVLKLKIRAEAIEGKANEAVLNFLAEQLKCSPRSIQIVHGLKSRGKRVRLDGFTLAKVLARLSISD